MKKNVMMRVAAMLLVCVLASTCGISGTFAKYVTSDNGSDFARVAKWGVQVEVESFNMFTDKYETDDGKYTGAYSVDSNGNGDVLAPGTGGEFVDISVKGRPEVATEVSVAAVVTLSSNWTVVDDKGTPDPADDETKFYCPITVTVGTTPICGLNFDNAAAFVAEIQNAITGYSHVYGPNEDLSLVDANFDISWAWAFTGATGTAINQTDEYDTQLGNKATTEVLTLQIDLSITVTQVN